jgi:glycosyltransferase involved in cell wall biosynthesis
LHDYQLICPNYKLFTQGSPCERCNPHKYWNAIRYKCVQDSRLSSALAAAEMGLHNVLLKSYKKGISQFIAPSQFLHDKLVEWGWTQDQVTYLPHFSTLTPNPQKRKKQILFAGRLTKEKGVRVLAEAAAAIDAPILIAGTGEEEEWLKENAPENVQLLGFQQPPALHALMAESAAVIVPSLWYENAPMVVYESLALGTPVIGSALGGLPELIEEGVTGTLIEPENSADISKKVNMLLKKTLQITENQYNENEHIHDLTDIYEKTLA